MLTTILASSMAFAGSTHVGQPNVSQASGKWGSHESHVRFYEKMIAKYNQNPKAFSQRHGLMAKSIRNPAFKAEMTRRLLAHPARFIKYHLCFSRFLDGELRRIVSASPNPTPETPASSTIPQTLASQSSSRDVGPTPTSPTGSTTPINPAAPAVPEPSSIILLGTATILGGIAHCRVLRRRRVTASRHGV